MTSLVMRSAYACVLFGAASAALAVFYGANGRYVRVKFARAYGEKDRR